MKQIHWVRKMFRDWRNHKHGLGLEYIHCDLEETATITAESLNFALCCFIVEVKKINEDNFPSKTLFHIIICIQFHLECMTFTFKLLNDPAFKDLKFTLDNIIKARTSQGIGISIKKAEVLIATDEDLLWSIGFLGMSYPKQLLNMVIFCVGKGFALHACKEHHALHGLPFWFQFKFMRDPDGEVFLCYAEDNGLKMNKGRLMHRQIKAKSMEMYASHNAELCPYVSLLSTYFSSPRIGPAVPSTSSHRQNILRRLGTSIDWQTLTVSKMLSGRCTMMLAFQSSHQALPEQCGSSWKLWAIGPWSYTHSKEPWTSRENWPASAFSKSSEQPLVAPSWI